MVTGPSYCTKVHSQFIENVYRGTTLEQSLVSFLKKRFPDADDVGIEDFQQIPGGFSRETFSCVAQLTRGGAQERLSLILRKDPPIEISILQTSRAVEHDLIESIRLNTGVPVSQSYGYELDPKPFGEAAMVIQRMHGNGNTSDLFNGGPDEDQVDDVVRHLCEVLVELHTSDIATIDPTGALSDPRGVGIKTTSWDDYIDSTCEYYISSYPSVAFDPSIMILIDLFQTLRRTKPRALPLALVHGDFNPANFLYENGKVTALIDWENSRVGDPREDLGWMTTMDLLSNTRIMDHPRDKGGFLAYYNELTGFNVTAEEINYFNMFGTANIAVPVNSAISRRLAGEHHQLLHVYLVQSSIPALQAFSQQMNYPGAAS